MDYKGSPRPPPSFPPGQNEKAVETVKRQIDGFYGFSTPATLGGRYSFIPNNQSADIP